MGENLLDEFLRLSRSGTLPASVPALLLWLIVFLFYCRHRQLLTKADLRRGRKQFYLEIGKGYLVVMTLLTIVGVILTLFLKPIMANIFRGELPPDAPPVRARVVAKVTPPVIPVKKAPHQEISYHGTADRNFASDWVVVGGEKLSGISMVLAAPHGQVTVVFATGGRNIPVSKLPQGFLDVWRITPQRLKAVDDTIKF